MNGAFATLLHNGSPYYVPKADTPVERAIAMVRAAGGIAVFAPPRARRRGGVVEPSVIADLAAAGLGGVEVDHPDHAPADRELLRELAAAHDLVTTGSSEASVMPAPDWPPQSSFSLMTSQTLCRKLQLTLRRQVKGWTAGPT